MTGPTGLEPAASCATSTNSATSVSINASDQREDLVQHIAILLFKSSPNLVPAKKDGYLEVLGLYLKRPRVKIYRSEAL
ncbi:MAG: hypothetical protein DMG96_28605 [Acidobacteria bacterium]|nr:MAG: hypothetical protein DMG96_28605 [Acidobacteriota bacterium]